MRCVDSQLPPGRCSTKPRSWCTGPPRSTICSPTAGASGGSFICASTSERRMVSGLLSTIPSAPRLPCSQIRVTVWAKFGSSRPGIATSRWLVREPSLDMAPVWGRRPAVSRRADVAALGNAQRSSRRLAALETPFVRKAQAAVIPRQIGRKWIERAGQLQDAARRLIQLRMAAAALDAGTAQPAVIVDHHLEHEAAGHPLLAGQRRKVEGAYLFDAAPPPVQV